MAESFSRWESDPLFSAANVVQDSADRMESIFRLLLHEQKLVQGDPSDTKLLSSLQYHKRDLVTALETTRWQLEDFERAVNLAALSDNANSRENAILKFEQFIRAIREQISHMEQSSSSVDDFNRSSLSPNLNEQETDGLALFLSGGDSRDHHKHLDSRSNLMKRFLETNTDSYEIVELKTEEVEPLPMNGLKYSDHGYESSKDRILWKVGSEASAFPQDSFGERESQEAHASRAHDLEFGSSSANLCSYDNRLRGSFWKFLRNFWIASKSKGSFTKRRKDGEVSDGLIVDAEQRNASSIANFSPAERDKHLCINAMQFHSWLESIQRRLQRSQYIILYSQFPIWLPLVILLTLAILGFLAFRIG